VIRWFLRGQLLKSRDLLLQEAGHIRGFMRLLMKRTNTGVPWTKEEITRLRSQLVRMSLYVPALIVFSLPFGSLLLPVLAEVLDRRKNDRTVSAVSAQREDNI
jgi:hypothetical protein